ncbi:hypothetical protein AB3N59_02665 [Leptospira sp. WS92.C1]
MRYPFEFSTPQRHSEKYQRIRSAAHSFDVALNLAEWFQILEAGTGYPVP